MTAATLCVVVSSALLIGCSTSMEYPKDLQYLPRTDYLVTQSSDAEPRTLPSPGQLDENIKKALEDKKVDLKKEDPKLIPENERKELDGSLRSLFGTPSRPLVGPLSRSEKSLVKMSTERQQGIQSDLALYSKSLAAAVSEAGAKNADIETLDLSTRTLKTGSELYRQHCMHCHGVSGDGRGSTGPWVHPHPRDYRKGAFKFISTSLTLGNRKPRRDDLVRVLEKGIDGTSMPAFGLLPKEQLNALVSYVIHLSIRGETEFETMKAFLEKGQAPDEGMRGAAFQTASRLVVAWALSNVNDPYAPPEYPAPYKDAEDKLAKKDATPEEKAEAEKVLAESKRRGYSLFLDKGGCMKCHTDYGRQSAYRYDTWNTLVQPRNLTTGHLRGGRRPLDLAWRLGGGIGPSAMPRVEGFSPEEFWDLTNFVQAMPYPAMLPSDIRQKIYPNEK
jgi:mono/diheme cytochrome c family protein